MKHWSRLWVVVAHIIFYNIFLVSVDVRAEGVNLFTNLQYQDVDTTTKNKETAMKTHGKYSRFTQQYNLDINKSIYPYVLFRTGGYFEQEKTRFNSEDSDSENTNYLTRPFVELNLTNPFVRAGTLYRKTEIREKNKGQATTRNHLEEYTGRLNLKPTGLPQVDMTYNRTLASDDFNTVDVVNQNFNLRARYEYKNFSSDYTHTRSENEDKLNDSETLAITDVGGFQVGKRFFDDRVSVDFLTRLLRTTVELGGSGDSNIRTTSQGSAFFLLDDSDPTTNTPGEFSVPVPGNTLNSVNIGIDPVSAGLDFGFATVVDTLYIVLLDSGISGVAGLFSWQVFRSDDQENWNPVIITSTRYNIFENRFEIVFLPGISTRYIKVVTTPVVTTPLDLLAPGEIRYSALESYVTIAGDSGFKQELTDQNYQLDVNWKMTDKSTVGYSLFYKNTETDPAGQQKERTTNSFNLRHIFNPIFVGNTRLLYNTISETDKEDATSYDFSMLLNANYLRTFSQALSFSGTYTDDEEGRSSRNGFLFRTRADLYKGVNSTLDTGYSWTSPAQEEDSSSYLVRFGVSLTPNSTMKLDISYSVVWNHEKDEPDSRNQQGALQFFWVPLSTLSFQTDLEFVDKKGGEKESEVFKSFAVNWSPFPEGTLQFTVGYNEELNNDDDKVTGFTPGIRWVVSRNILLTVDYTIGTRDSEVESSEFTSFSGDLRIRY